MNTRIKELRTFLGLTQKEFGNKLGFKSSISEIENGTAPIVERTIVAICSVFGVNEEWLRTGKGQMFITKDAKLNEFFKIYSCLDKPLKDFLIECAKNLLDAQNKL